MGLTVHVLASSGRWSGERSVLEAAGVFHNNLTVCPSPNQVNALIPITPKHSTALDLGWPRQGEKTQSWKLESSPRVEPMKWQHLHLVPTQVTPKKQSRFPISSHFTTVHVPMHA